MKKFSLSALDPLPEVVVVQGQSYPIHTDFRVILRIFRMLGDQEIGMKERPVLLRKMFYKGRYPRKAEEGFEWFVRCGREQSEAGGEKDFDYEQDAMELYSAFRQVYGIDLMEEKMHWWKFASLLNGVFCGENALSNKIQIRHVDDNKSKRQVALQRQKRAVQLTEAVSRTEAMMEQQIRERLEKGLPLGDLMSK